MGADNSLSERATSGQAEWLPVGLLHIGEGNPYQRIIRPHKVDRIARSYDPDLVGVIEVTKRTDGEYWVRDGHHRVAALRALDRTDDLVLCHVLVHTTMAGEARTARLMNKERTAWSAYDEFRAGMVEGESTMVAVKSLMDELGIKVQSGGSQPDEENGGILMAIGTAVKQYQRPGGPELLARTLTVLRDAWPNEPNRFRQTMVRGLASFLAHHDEYVEEDRLIHTLGRTSPDQLIDEARQLKRSYKWSVSAYVASAIEGAYNLRARNRIREVGAPTYANAIREYERRHRPATVATGRNLFANGAGTSAVVDVESKVLTSAGVS